jgi:AcrR family transcriptional regulator
MEIHSSARKKSGTVRRILKAAASIFSESGFSGARVDEIAKRARVNKATIYYHIGDKEKLYAEVISEGLFIPTISSTQ